MEKLSKITKMHQNGEKFLPKIFKISTNDYFPKTNPNHPKNNIYRSDTPTPRVPPCAPALAEPTYRGRVTIIPAHRPSHLEGRLDGVVAVVYELWHSAPQRDVLHVSPVTKLVAPRS